MAIQISGTEVISNSRGLNNIASVDATTAASITAAGVGGGGGETFTASGAISAGEVVILNSNGTVSPISITTGSELDVSYFTPSSTQPIRSRIHATTYNGVQYAHEVFTDSDEIYFHGGEGVSGSTTLYNYGYYVDAVAIPGTKDLYFTWRDNSSNWKAQYMSNSGTSYSLQGATQTLQSSVSYDSVKIVFDNQNNQYIAFAFNAYATTDENYYCIGTLTGYNISWGSVSSSFLTTSINNSFGYNNVDAYVEPNTGKIAYLCGSDIIVGTPSSGSISWGTAASLTSFQPERLAGQISLNKTGTAGIAFHAAKSGSTYYGYATPFSVSGNNVTVGTSYQVPNSNSSTSYLNGGSAGLYIERLDGWIAMSDGGIYPEWRLLTTDGSTITSSRVFTSNFYGFGFTSWPVYMTEFKEKESVIIRNYNGVEEVEYESDQTDADSWIGIAEENIADGSSGKVTLFAGINDQQSGLTIGSYYAVQNDGSLGTSGSRTIGKALSASKIQITEKSS